MTDGQFYTFVGLGVVGILLMVVMIILLYSVASVLGAAYRELGRVNFNVAHLQTLGERWNADMQSRVYSAVTAAQTASGYLSEIAQPIRDQKRWQERAKYGLGPED